MATDGLEGQSQRRGHPDDSGFTMIEVIVAMVIFAGFTVALLSLTLAAQALGVANRDRVAATNLAAREIDIVRSQFYSSSSAAQNLVDAGTVTNPDQLSGGTAGHPLVLDGTAYTVVRTASWSAVLGSASACDGGTLFANAPVRVTVTVTWASMGSVKPVVNSALMSPGKGNGISSTAAFAAVKVVDSAGAPNPGRGVKVTGSNGDARTGVTDASGCAILQLTPGASGAQYRAQLTDSGYMDIVNGITDPGRDLGLVLPGTLNTAAGSTPFTYDLPGHITLAVVDADGAPADDATVAALGLTATVRITGPHTPGTAFSKDVSLATGSTALPDDLWPTTFAVDFNPTGAADPTTVPLVVHPGQTSIVRLTLPSAQVQITGGPPAMSSVVVVPAGTPCGATSRRADPTGFALMPGTWDLYADGSGYSCSAGPAGVTVASGATVAVPWTDTTLQVTGATDPRVLRAVPVDGTVAPGCPAPAAQTTALVLTPAMSGAQQVPAGSWYLYWASAAGTCETGVGEVAAPYGQATTYPIGVAP
jgi:prepilin-type N-terminal cleavage/methylation domain-containing protein